MLDRLRTVLRGVRYSSPGFEAEGFTNVVEISVTGFSTVYRADQRRLNRTVAIKVLHVGRFTKDGLYDRFAQECKVLGALGHYPHVVTVFHEGIDKTGRPYFVMEYLPAGSLADRLTAGGALPWNEALAIGVKLAGTLESTHRAGILHLDIKPGNVLVGRDGEPLLADFGVARLRAVLGAATESVVLTPAFAAPERFVGREPTPAADVYSLGTTLFALFAGRPPFLRDGDGGHDPLVVFGRKLYEQSPTLGTEFPEDLRAVVGQAMARSPADRFASAADLAAALQSVQRAHGLQVTPLPPMVLPDELPPAPEPLRTSRRRLITIVSLVVATALALGGVVAWPRPCQPQGVPGDGALSIGTLVPKTGPFLSRGAAMEAGVTMAYHDIEAAGGIPGVNVLLDDGNRLDSGGGRSADLARRSTDALVSSDVDVVIGPSTSQVTLAAIDPLVCAGRILFAPSNAARVFSTYSDHGLYFRTSFLTLFEAEALAGQVIADGNATVVVMSRGDVYGNDMRQVFGNAFEARGGRVLESFAYDPDASDYQPEVARISRSDPDAIVLIGFAETGPILATMIDHGLGPRDKRVYGTVANMSSTLASTVKPGDPSVLAGMKGTTLKLEEAFTRRLRQVAPALQDFGYAAHAYDAVVITALAAASAGTDAPAAVAAQINAVTRQGTKCRTYADCLGLVREGHDIDYDGVSGPLEFTDPGEPSSGTYVIREFRADGSLQALRTETVSLRPDGSCCR